ncbi:MAG TPA: methyltransferase domain-containing protein [Burkholderiaceae bacterium]|nr:methyltransferase domain-containing protein [Burkholderiaceae bacterium]
MSVPGDIVAHYSRGRLLERLDAALCEDGCDPLHPTLEQLAPYDQFHGRGLEATTDAAALMPATMSDRLLDIGSGFGGPARWLARHFGCRVVGVDLTPEFCLVANVLAQRTGTAGAVEFHVANALALPFADETFDGAYSMNVSMNIAEKPALYREVHRVLKPGGWLMLSEMARGDGPEPDYPTPWAASADASFLTTPQETHDGLQAAGFEVLRFRSTRAQALAYGARSREAVARGEKPPHRAVMLVHERAAGAAMSNSARAVAEARVEPIELLARKATLR